MNSEVCSPSSLSLASSRAATPLDILRLVHPQRDARICLLLIPRDVSDQEWTWLPHFDAALHDERRRLCRWRSNVPYHIWLHRCDAGKILGELKSANSAGWDVYYSLATYKPDAQRRRIEDTLSIGTMYLDFDEMTPAAEAFSRGQPWREIPAPHAIIATSPQRCQCLWQLDRRYCGETQLRHISSTLRDLATITGADIAATDTARVFRLPGFYNHKRARRHHLVTASLQTDITPTPLAAFRITPLDLLPYLDIER